MISVTKRIYVNQALSEVFEKQLEVQGANVKAKGAGFLSRRTLRPSQLGQPYIVLEVWESAEHFRRWDEVVGVRNQLPQAAFDKPTTLEVRRLVASPKLEPATGPSRISALARTPQRCLHG